MTGSFPVVDHVGGSASDGTHSVTNRSGAASRRFLGSGPLLDQFGRHHTRGNLLRFLDDPRVKPTNNDSERGFRFAVIQRKVSQCSKTAGGARAFEAFASVIKTAMRQGKDVVERLTGLFRGIDPQG
jgi:Transposase IS66 family